MHTPFLDMPTVRPHRPAVIGTTSRFPPPQPGRGPGHNRWHYRRQLRASNSGSRVTGGSFPEIRLRETPVHPGRFRPVLPARLRPKRESLGHRPPISTGRPSPPKSERANRHHRVATGHNGGVKFQAVSMTAASRSDRSHTVEDLWPLFRRFSAIGDDLRHLRVRRPSWLTRACATRPGGPAWRSCTPAPPGARDSNAS
jgi:hypothetical protein